MWNHIITFVELFYKCPNFFFSFLSRIQKLWLHSKMLPRTQQICPSTRAIQRSWISSVNCLPNLAVNHKIPSSEKSYLNGKDRIWLISVAIKQTILPLIFLRREMGCSKENCSLAPRIDFIQLLVYRSQIIFRWPSFQLSLLVQQLQPFIISITNIFLWMNILITNYSIPGV